MTKKITPKQHARALLKMLKNSQKEIKKYLEVNEQRDISEEKLNAIAEKSLKIMEEQRDIFDSIDKEYKLQKSNAK